MYYLQIFSVVAVTLFYPLTFTVNRTAGIIHLLLALTALISIIMVGRNSSGIKFMQLTKAYWPLHIAMAGPAIAVALHTVFTSNVHLRDFEYPLRLALFPLVFWAVYLIPLKYRDIVKWGFIAASLLAVIKMSILTGNGQHRYGTDFIPIIIFSLWTLITSLFALYAYFWTETKNKWTATLTGIALFSGFYTAYLSQARGVWVAIPVLIIITLIALSQFTSRKKTVGLLLAVVLACGTLQFGDIAKGRLADAESDIKTYFVDEKADTSIGVRFQLWRGSLVMFKEHPLFGVGITDFKQSLQELAKRNIVSEYSASHPHSHNEILFMMAQLGLFGLIAIISLYFVPGWYFIRLLRNTDTQTRMLAASGLSLCVGFLILGFTDVVFMWREAFPFYAISIAFFLTSIIRRRQFLLADQTCINTK
jgi:O-antigen ligase